MTKLLRATLLALTASKSLLVAAQCGGYNWLPNAPQCGVNFGDGFYLESNLIPVDEGCPNALGSNYQAKATFTDYEGVVSTVGLVKPVTSPADPAATVRFLYDIYYGDIQDGSPVTVNYFFPRNTYSMNLPPFTVHHTVAYTDTTTTRTHTEETTTTSTSTIHKTSTRTVTSLSTTTAMGATQTITLRPVTKTRTITRSVPATTKTVFTTKTVTTTLPCIPKSPKRLRDLERRDTVFESKTYAVPTCGNTRPTTRTSFTTTAVRYSTVTSTSTEIKYFTTTDRTVTTTYIQTVIINATGRVTITPPPVTVTKNVNAPRRTVTTSITRKITVTKYATKTCCKPPPPKYTTTKKVVKTTTKCTTKKVVKTTPKAPGYKPKTTAKCTKNIPKTTKRY
ncbi:hypothetical protein TWF281_004431 [Arthrobotrys megalospora]